MGLNIFPNLLAPRANQARELLFQAFKTYYASGGLEDASRTTQGRYKVNTRRGLTLSDIEHLDVSVSYGLLVNTVPAAAWALFYTYSDPRILGEMREATSKYVQTTKDPSTGRLIHNLNIAEFVAGYPFLHAFIYEILRIHSTSASGRMILRDTLIDNRYLLKKDSVLLIPTVELHNNTTIWGPAPGTFDPHSFMNKKSKAPNSAYRSFGSGSSVCPGKYFAANEISIILVAMICKFDLKPLGTNGVWKVPEGSPHITTSVLTPSKDVKVELIERQEKEEEEWKFSWEAKSEKTGK